MAGDLRVWKTSDLIAGGHLVIGDGYRAKNEELGTSGLPFARAGNIDAGFNFKDADRFPTDNLSRVGNKVSIPGDVVFTSKGTVGRFGFVSETTEQFVYSPQLCFWRSLDPNLINPRFLYYWMHGPEFYAQVREVASQTDMAEYVSLSDQRRMQVTLPDQPTQAAIAEVLGLLDDKIDLNRRRATVLEAMARAIFKSWFIDFDPVRRKAEGLDSGLSKDLDALFPDAFTPEGPPVGWSEETAGEIFEISGGNTPSTSEPENWGGQHQWATPKDLSSLLSPVLLQTERQITDAGLARSTSGLLPVGSLLLSSRAPIGYMAFATRPVAINQGFAGFVRKAVSTVYAWAWCAAHLEMIRGNAGGSTFPEISKSVLRTLPMLRPSDEVAAAFEATAAPLVSRMIAAVEEAATLGALRDSLLPRLISGEMRIGEAKQSVVAA